MSGTLNRCSRWLMLMGSGAVLLQATGCELTMEVLQTGFLGTIAGTILYLARNV